MAGPGEERYRYRVTVHRSAASNMPSWTPFASSTMYRTGASAVAWYPSAFFSSLVLNTEVKPPSGVLISSMFQVQP